MNVDANKAAKPARAKIIGLVVFVVLLALPVLAFATTDTDVLPYQKGLDTFKQSMEGPVPFVISLAGIIGCGAMLIFGGEISGFLRTMVFIVLVVAIIVQATSVIGLLGGSWTGPQNSTGAARHLMAEPNSSTA